MAEARARRVSFVSLGCRLNRVETDLIASRLEEAGCQITREDQADLVIINTCAVTGEAEAKARKAIRHAYRLPQAPIVMATGCVASLFAEELASVAPGIIVEPDKERIPDAALSALGIEGHVSSGSVLAVSPTPTGRTRPGIKIQDGCNNRCSYCIVWKARGPSRSLAPGAVLRAVTDACERGAREVVLTGINLGNYRSGELGKPGEEGRLEHLLSYLLDKSSIQRIRISSIEPPDVTDDLLDTMAGSGGRVAPFLHVCLQSGCDKTLRRMRRVYDTILFRGRVERARKSLPHVAIGTDVIVGFPGETQDEFEESLAFAREMDFARMHVFRYSRRPGTPAADAPNQVSANDMADRALAMRGLGRRMRLDNMRRLVGEEDDVLVQDVGVAVSSHLYDVSVDPSIPPGELVHVRFDRLQSDVLVGMVTGNDERYDVPSTDC